MSELISVRRDNEIVELSLNKPNKFNAFDFEMITCLANHLVELSVDDNIRGIVITGEGKAFCAGGDLKWINGFPHGPSAAFYKMAANFHHAILEIRRMPKPVIAAINGIAAGGGFMLALACDFRVISKSASFRQAYTSRGLCIDGGGTFSLPRLVGLARALEIAAFDKPISSEQALSWGLVTKVVEDSKALEEALRMAHELAKGSLNSFKWVKRLLIDSYNSTLEEHLENERYGLSSCASHIDGKEGLQAFAEKRKPVFFNQK